jgi:hypothetical protein
MNTDGKQACSKCGFVNEELESVTEIFPKLKGSIQAKLISGPQLMEILIEIKDKYPDDLLSWIKNNISIPNMPIVIRRNEQLKDLLWK